MRVILIAIFASITTLAQGQFVMSTAPSRPLPREVTAATQTAMTYFDLEASCRHVLSAEEAASVRLAGRAALVAAGYLPEGADAAVRELDRQSKGAKPWTAAQCLRGINVFRASSAGNLERIESMAANGRRP